MMMAQDTELNPSMKCRLVAGSELHTCHRTRRHTFQTEAHQLRGSSGTRGCTLRSLETPMDIPSLNIDPASNAKNKNKLMSEQTKTSRGEIKMVQSWTYLIPNLVLFLKA